MCSMTDLHCHTLCLVDDGAKDATEMQKMLDTAYADGIRNICFTPHFKRHHFADDADIDAYNSKINESFQLALEYVEDKYPDMKLFLGNEIMYHHDIYDSISRGHCLRIANGAYVLVEFVPTMPFFEIRTALSNLLRKGVRPILAHIERYNDLVSDIDRVVELKELGVLIQVNASSITRFKFGKSAKFIKSLFKRSLVDLIATDAHDAKFFSQSMSKAVSLIDKRYGNSMAIKVSQTIPNMILANKQIH